MESQVKTMLALFVPEGFNNDWIGKQMVDGGFDPGREVISFGAYEDDSDESIGTWLMQEVISKIH